MDISYTFVSFALMTSGVLLFAYDKLRSKPIKEEQVDKFKDL